MNIHHCLPVLVLRIQLGLAHLGIHEARRWPMHHVGTHRMHRSHRRHAHLMHLRTTETI